MSHLACKGLHDRTDCMVGLRSLTRHLTRSRVMASPFVHDFIMCNHVETEQGCQVLSRSSFVMHKHLLDN